MSLLNKYVYICMYIYIYMCMYVCIHFIDLHYGDCILIFFILLDAN